MIMYLQVVDLDLMEGFIFTCHSYDNSTEVAINCTEIGEKAANQRSLLLDYSELQPGMDVKITVSYSRGMCRDVSSTMLKGDFASSFI